MKSLRNMVCVAAMLAGTFVAVSSAPASAVPSTDPTLALTSGGITVSGATDGSPFTSSATAPITLNGQTSQVITKTWDRSHLRFASGSITAPEGWTVEYTTNGTTWSGTAPADLTTVSGVRTTGSLNSIGYSNGLQTSISNAASTVKQATVGSVAVTGLGDGYDVFFDANHSKIFNVFHHSSPAQIDCHILSNGARCTGYPVSMPNSLGTNERATGVSVGTKVWVPAGYGSSPGGGFACFNVSGGACTTAFVSLTSNVNTGSYNNVGNVARVDQYVLTQNMKDGKVLCLDTTTEAACASMPAGGFDLGTGAVLKYPSNLVTIGTRVYSNDGSGDVGCLDTSTWARCAGWTAPWATTKYIQMFELPDANGNIIGLCAFDVNSAACVDSSKATITTPSSLNSARAAVPEYAMADPNLYGYTSKPQVAGSRVYWSNMVWNSTQAGAKVTCWDASLNSGAGGICTFSSNGANFINEEAYALAIDPDNANCLWSNDDNGNIESFDVLTGSATCPVSQDAVVEIPYNVAVPRFSCTEAGRIRLWDSITIHGTGVTLSAMRVTVKKNGLAVSGGSNLAADSNGRVDLSGLSVSSTGTQPKFEITALGLTTNQANTITGDVKYLSDAPQLCLNLTPQAYCPTSVGVASGASLSRPADTVSLAVTNVAGSTTNSFTAAESVTRSAISNCVGSVTGNVARTTGSGNVVIPGATVTLRDSNGTVVSTTTSDASGNYTFPYLYPHAYTVHFSGSQQASTVTAAAVTTKNFVITVPPPVSSNISNTTAQNVAVSTAIIASADSITSIDTSSVRVKVGSGGWGSSVTVPNEGTWTISGTSLVFTPLAAFSGTATPIDYQVADGFGVTTSSTATVAVTASTITASPDSRTGGVNETLTLSATATSGSVPVVPGSVELRDDGTSSYSTSLSLPGVGRFVASQTANSVTFAPENGWTGIRSVTYRVRDVSGKTASSTLTVKISPEAPPRVILRNGRNGANITWADSPTSSVHTYVVRLNGRIICSVPDANRTCTFPRFIGRASDINVTSVGGDDTTSPATEAVKLDECRVVGSIQFSTDLAVVTQRADALLKRIAGQAKRQKVSGICIIGHTDARDTYASNNNLSYWRATNAYAHIKGWLAASMSVTLDYAGEYRPRATNGTPHGMYVNRRVDIGIRP